MDFQEMYKKYGEPQVRSSFERHKIVYRQMSYEFDDLAQEIRVLLWDLCNQIDQGKIIIKPWSELNIPKEKQIGDPIEHYIRRSIQHHLLKIFMRLPGFLDLNSAEQVDLADSEEYSEERVIEVNNHDYENLYSDLFLDVVKEQLTEREYKIIYDRFVLKEEFVEIGKKLNLSKQRVYQLYEKIMKKLKYRLTK